MQNDLKSLVQGEVSFEFYRDGNLYYRTANGAMLFPVPISEAGIATFMARDKGILFMRYIRKFAEVCEKERG
jgi:hypothetical protein